jgi:superfamily II DNA/RNA helicase
MSDETGKGIGYKGLTLNVDRLSGNMRRRRNKELLKQLQALMDKNLFVPLTDQQRQLHLEYGDTVAKLVNKWKKLGFLSERERQILLNCLNMMRMVCDTTFIIDQKTNYQTKLDELFNILDELFLEPEEKVVIFSQWERMTRLIAAGLTERNIRFENLHGGIPSKDRAALFANFNNDPECRVFLSTDAGGVGLNLQSAANLINMDIPWNPAVLEQRIGRIYRMGQRRNVSITNIVALDSIEHEMLAKLKFKSAVAEGILDYGEDSIFAGDDKFKKFIELVESITPGNAAETTLFDEAEKEEISQPLVSEEDGPALVSAAEAMYEEADSDHLKTGPTAPGTAAPDAAELIQKGASFLSQLMNTLNDPAATKALTQSLTETDSQTGQAYLKIPVQNTEVVEQALSFLSKLFAR